MTPQLRALEVFAATVALPATARAEFLDRECASDADLRGEVEDLLHHDRTTARMRLDRPALGTGFHMPSEIERIKSPIRVFPTQAGPFLVQAEIGSGSMGIVYRARQDPHGRSVALKLLRSGLDSGGDRHRFTLETEALCKLKHPGIAHLYQPGTLSIDGREYGFLAMELVEGIPLRQWSHVHRPGLAACLRVMIDVCDAIESAHRQGVVHRDLKPENILVELGASACRPRILDFGVAKLLADRIPNCHEKDGDVVGTLTYMSPEQAAGSPDVDGRADVYALGAITFELLTGRPLLALGPIPHGEVVRRIVEKAPPPLSRLDPHLRGDLEGVVARALAKDPNKRYPTALDFAKDLKAVLAHCPVSVRKPTSIYRLQCFARRQRLAFASISLMVAAIFTTAGAGWWGFARSRADLDRLVRTSQFTVVEVVARLSTLAGTSQVRADALRYLLPQIEECVRLRPDDFATLACREQILRLLGDIEVAAGRWETASLLRRQAEETSRSLLVKQPNDPALRADWATAVVRVGDAELHTRGRDPARTSYESAYSVFQDLATAFPDECRHFDDLFWSCDRLAFLAIETGRFEDAEELLERGGRLLTRLDELRPGSTQDLTGQRALHCMWSHLERARGNRGWALQRVRMSIEPAKERVRREPLSPQAAVDLAGSVLSYIETGRDQLDPADSAQLLREATDALDRLLTHEPDLQVAQSLRDSCRKLSVRQR